jgi:hypothetical protein
MLCPKCLPSTRSIGWVIRRFLDSTFLLIKWPQDYSRSWWALGSQCPFKNHELATQGFCSSHRRRHLHTNPELRTLSLRTNTWTNGSNRLLKTPKWLSKSQSHLPPRLRCRTTAHSIFSQWRAKQLNPSYHTTISESWRLCETQRQKSRSLTMWAITERIYFNG